MEQRINYKPLTKKVKDQATGQLKIVCTLDGMEMCQIHNGKCEECKSFQIILNQLNAFEEIYLSSDEENCIHFVCIADESVSA